MNVNIVVEYDCDDIRDLWNEDNIKLIKSIDGVKRVVDIVEAGFDSFD